MNCLSHNLIQEVMKNMEIEYYGNHKYVLKNKLILDKNCKK